MLLASSSDYCGLNSLRGGVHGYRLPLKEYKVKREDERQHGVVFPGHS